MSDSDGGILERSHKPLLGRELEHGRSEGGSAPSVFLGSPHAYHPVPCVSSSARFSPLRRGLAGRSSVTVAPPCTPGKPYLVGAPSRWSDAAATTALGSPAPYVIAEKGVATAETGRDLAIAATASASRGKEPANAPTDPLREGVSRSDPYPFDRARTTAGDSWKSSSQGRLLRRRRSSPFFRFPDTCSLGPQRGKAQPERWWRGRPGTSTEPVS